MRDMGGTLLSVILLNSLQCASHVRFSTVVRFLILGALACFNFSYCISTPFGLQNPRTLMHTPILQPDQLSVSKEARNNYSMK